jgi:hypothetical protein
MLRYEVTGGKLPWWRFLALDERHFRLRLFLAHSGDERLEDSWETRTVASFCQLQLQLNLLSYLFSLALRVRGDLS